MHQLVKSAAVEHPQQRQKLAVGLHAAKAAVDVMEAAGKRVRPHGRGAPHRLVPEEEAGFAGGFARLRPVTTVVPPKDGQARVPAGQVEQRREFATHPRHMRRHILSVARRIVDNRVHAARAPGRRGACTSTRTTEPEPHVSRNARVSAHSRMPLVAGDHSVCREELHDSPRDLANLRVAHEDDASEALFDLSHTCEAHVAVAELPSGVIAHRCAHERAYIRDAQQGLRVGCSTAPGPARFAKAPAGLGAEWQRRQRCAVGICNDVPAAVRGWVG
eukprot:1341380-Prymnesium_polylepis.1